MLAEVYLALGSNLGDRAANIAGGLQSLRRVSRRVEASSLYETRPWGFEAQPRFLNAACRIWTPLDPFQLMAITREVESTLGRERSFANGPRVLDIDILLYGQAVIEAPGLSIPHPRMAEREFVLAPLAEIAPGLRHPVLKERIRSLLRRLPAHGSAVRKVAPPPLD